MHERYRYPPHAPPSSPRQRQSSSSRSRGATFLCHASAQHRAHEERDLLDAVPLPNHHEPGSTRTELDRVPRSTRRAPRDKRESLAVRSERAVESPPRAARSRPVLSELVRVEGRNGARNPTHSTIIRTRRADGKCHGHSCPGGANRGNMHNVHIIAFDGRPRCMVVCSVYGTGKARACLPRRSLENQNARLVVRKRNEASALVSGVRGG